MPEFLHLYMQDLSMKAMWLKEAYSRVTSSIVEKYLKEFFDKYWISSVFPESSPEEFEVIAVDSSSRHITMANGGIFYVVRAIAVANGGTEFKKVYIGFDYSSSSRYEEIISRTMEWLEHEIILEILDNGFKGCILIDGSIYGRLAHVPLEIKSVYNRDFMIRYFETLIKLLKISREKNILLIGISKESRSSFFREFLIRSIILKLAGELGIEESEIYFILNMALDRKKEAIEMIEKLPETIRELMKEYIMRKPDFQLIMHYATTPGYTIPLVLSIPTRTKRAFKLIKNEPERYLRSAFPLLSTDKKFVEYALNIVKELPNMPSIVSFHVLPQINDTPMRIDIPSWVFGIEHSLSEVNFNEIVNVDVNKLLKIIFAGYCGLENYNIWLSTADRKVKFRRNIFENIYLPKFEEIIGRTATSRGYRRVRFP